MKLSSVKTESGRRFSAVRAFVPTKQQEDDLLRAVGAVRFAQNALLALTKQMYEAGEKTSLTSISLHTLWREHRNDIAVDRETGEVWWNGVSKEAFQYGAERLARSYQAFFASLSGKRKGRKSGFPKFRKKGQNDSFKFCSVGKRTSSTLHIPRIGTVKLLESFDLPTGVRIVSVTVRQKAGRWFASFNLFEESFVAPKKREIDPSRPGSVIGIDFGVGDRFATIDDGETTSIVANPRQYRSEQKSLRRLSKGISRKQRGSNNRNKAKVCLARKHAQISNRRSDFIHKFTTDLVKTHDEIVIEDLNLQGMKKMLGKSVDDVALGEARRQLVYKAEWYGATLTTVDRYFPSSKNCSSCGVKNTSLKLSDRTWTCASCGTTHDRDANAATNLRAASSAVAACGVASSGVDLFNAKLATTKQEDSLTYGTSKN